MHDITRLGPSSSFPHHLLQGCDLRGCRPRGGSSHSVISTLVFKPPSFPPELFQLLSCHLSVCSNRSDAPSLSRRWRGGSLAQGPRRQTKDPGSFPWNQTTQPFMEELAGLFQKERIQPNVFNSVTESPSVPRACATADPHLALEVQLNPSSLRFPTRSQMRSRSIYPHPERRVWIHPCTLLQALPKNVRNSARQLLNRAVKQKNHLFRPKQNCVPRVFSSKKLGKQVILRNTCGGNS